MDRFILGDNQFFGVSHMSEEKGMNREMKFHDINSIIEILDTAYGCGIHSFSFSTHDRLQLLCDHFRNNPSKYADLRLYPALPYAHKYATLVNEKGIGGAIKDVLISNNTAGQMFHLMAKGIEVALTQDPIKIMKLLVDAEIKMFNGLNIQVIFLQNIVTDLLLGFGIKDVFVEYVTHVEQRYKCRAGFMTLNMPKLVDFLLSCGIKDPIVCSAINKVGFQMNPDIASYEEALRTKPFTPLAMSVMAAGAVPPKEAFEYIAGLKNVKSILFGASTKSHVEQTKKLLETYFLLKN
jgi:hypothetical protein